MQEFIAFPKITRLNKDIVVTEKLDGTNAQIFINDDSTVLLAGSRKRWIAPGNDNFGFASWVYENREELLKLGPGSHFGEWWGVGIQRNYGLHERRFSLFNSARWSNPETRPKCCDVVPVIGTRNFFDTAWIKAQLLILKAHGSYAAPGFMDPEGIIIYNTANGEYYKETFDNNPKGEV